MQCSYARLCMHKKKSEVCIKEILHTLHYNGIYITLAWMFKDATWCLTHTFPGKYHGKAICQ